MPFGLCNAPATFQRFKHLLVAGFNWVTCLVYIDNIIVFSANFEDHMRDMHKVLERLQAAGLVLRGSKCRVAVDSVKHLGHLVSVKGLSPDPKKVEKLHNFPRCRSTKNIRSFLSLAGYYRRFVHNFARITAALFDRMQMTDP